MREKGFATIFGLCLILAVAFVVKGIQAAEANHAREVLSFELEQILQSAAESGIIEASATGNDTLSKTVTLERGGQTIAIEVEVLSDAGKIYFGSIPKRGKYFMSRAMTKSPFWSENIYRRAYAYVLDGEATIHFMELP